MDHSKLCLVKYIYDVDGDNTHINVRDDLGNLIQKKDLRKDTHGLADLDNMIPDVIKIVKYYNDIINEEYIGMINFIAMEQRYGEYGDSVILNYNVCYDGTLVLCKKYHYPMSVDSKLGIYISPITYGSSRIYIYSILTDNVIDINLKFKCRKVHLLNGIIVVECCDNSIQYANYKYNRDNNSMIFDEFKTLMLDSYVIKAIDGNGKYLYFITKSCILQYDTEFGTYKSTKCDVVCPRKLSNLWLDNNLYLDVKTGLIERGKFGNLGMEHLVLPRKLLDLFVKQVFDCLYFIIPKVLQELIFSYAY